ncbi:hypothetical protein PPACK8108_LOCUS11128 [Phakopsora pachyrhizi]|uniref:Uncharacterized protein n=1 Tax=Phakopsora pachyrhizi TaxID=170000 RepID=A0AAV0B1H3_PHAPC|nr:hypothetical protein PPACK8108_LOCUS11128 [Phakopsora pachyrhizi]
MVHEQGRILRINHPLGQVIEELQTVWGVGEQVAGLGNGLDAPRGLEARSEWLGNRKILAPRSSMCNGDRAPAESKLLPNKKSHEFHGTYTADSPAPLAVTNSVRGDSWGMAGGVVDSMSKSQHTRLALPSCLIETDRIEMEIAQEDNQRDKMTLYCIIQPAEGIGQLDLPYRLKFALPLEASPPRGRCKWNDKSYQQGSVRDLKSSTGKRELSKNIIRLLIMMPLFTLPSLGQRQEQEAGRWAISDAMSICECQQGESDGREIILRSEDGTVAAWDRGWHYLKICKTRDRKI